MSELIDNRAHRIAVLKDIIKHLHSGAAPELVKQRLRELVGRNDPTEIMAMEQQLMAEGMPVEELRSMCDLHSQVTRDVLVQIAPPCAITSLSSSAVRWRYACVSQHFSVRFFSAL